MSKKEVGDYLNDYFVSSFQKVSSFVIAGNQKQGGNVASYFCTPQGRVVHAVAGPVDAATMLREARWAVETWKLAQLEAGTDRIRFRKLMRQAHAERLQMEHQVDLRRITCTSVMPRLPLYGNNAPTRHGSYVALDKPGKVHLLLAFYPLPKIEQVYRVVFERILDQKLSTIPVVQR